MAESRCWSVRLAEPDRTLAPPRVIATPAAEALIAALIARHGPIMLHQSSGCCDGSAPMCFLRGEFRVGAGDVLLGCIAGDTPVWIGETQFAYWRYSQLVLDAAPGRAAGMSLETSEDMRFIARARLFDDAEVDLLVSAGEPPRGSDA
jgi:uncharacterized protein (DUF779 family)